MSIKPKQRELRDKNITDPKDFDQEYDSLKGTMNGGLDKQNIPLSSLDASNFKNNTFCSYYLRYLKMDEDVVETTSGGNYDKFAGQTYNTYAGGWYESSNPLVIENMREGMCQVEFNATYILNKIFLSGVGGNAPVSPTPSITNEDFGFCHFQLRHNGNVIADCGKMVRNLQTFHLCASIPVATGRSEFSVAWRFNGRRTDLLNYPLDQRAFYWTGGSLLAINYYR